MPTRSSTSAGAPAASRTIVFSHANSYPAGTYRLLFEHWRAAGWRVEAVETLGHDARYPVTTNWPRLVEQLAAFVDGLGVARPVLVGHSLGGLLSLMLASQRPDIPRALVMLDSPVFSGWRARSLQALKASRWIERLPPGKISRRRRYQWPTREAVHAHFAGKSVFARWDPRVLADYVQAGFVERDGHLTLAFTREVETRIYNTLPHQLGELLHRHPLKCPVSFIAGTQSIEMRQGGVAGVRALARDHLVWMEGTHLYPMEKPDETARLVLDQIKKISA